MCNCTKCPGWYEDYKSGHGCDGTDENCAEICPVPIPVQILCSCECHSIIKELERKGK